jgi:hypothetical protein
VTAFDDRLVAAYAILDRSAGYQLPVDVADQAKAAARDARCLLHRLGAIEELVVPGRFHGCRDLNDPGRHSHARLLAAVIACRPCWHLRQNGSQPSVAALPTRRANCRRCAHTARRPVIPEDHCDICDALVDDNIFWPVRAQMGSLVVVGDMCRRCRDVINPEPDA